MRAETYARVAVEITQLSDRIKPGLATDDPKYNDIRNLIVYHLRSAASKCREVSEAMAVQEPKA